MIGSTGTQNAALSFSQASVHADRLREKAKKDGSDAVKTLADYLEQKDEPDKADSLLQQLEQAKSALSQASSGSDAADQRKAAAQEKIDRIKARLQMLRLLAAINPEAAAKLAKQLARELAAAAKEYAAAGGGGGGGAAMASVPNIPAPSPDASASAAAGTGAAGAGAATTAGAAGLAAGVNQDSRANSGQGGQTGQTLQQATQAAVAEAGLNTDTAENATEGASAEAMAAALQDGASPQTKGAQKDAQDPRHVETPQERREKERESVLDWANEQVGNIAGAAGAARADSQFANDVRVIKSQLEAILEAAKRKLKLDQKPQANQDIKEAESALRETDKALDDITGGVSVGLYSSFASVNITV